MELGLKSSVETHKSTIPTGATVADLTLGKAFVLDSTVTGQYTTGGPQMRVFTTADYTSASSTSIPINVAGTTTYSSNANPSRRSRWGTNGLVFRTSTGVYNLRSNLVKDLSSVSADLGVAIATTGSTITGSSSTYTYVLNSTGLRSRQLAQPCFLSGKHRQPLHLHLSIRWDLRSTIKTPS